MKWYAVASYYCTSVPSNRVTESFSLNVCSAYHAPFFSVVSKYHDFPSVFSALKYYMS